MLGKLGGALKVSMACESPILASWHSAPTKAKNNNSPQFGSFNKKNIALATAKFTTIYFLGNLRIGPIGIGFVHSKPFKPFLIKQVSGRGQEQRESGKTVLHLLFSIIY